jgi:hypothetical protein
MRNQTVVWGYVELCEKTEGRLFTGPRFVISRSYSISAPG